MSELKLPPRRPLPPEVRDRIRERVLADLDRPRRFRHGRAPLAVAAGVAVLAAGAVIVGQSVHGGPGEPGDRIVPPTGTSSKNRPLDLRKANSELDRCWAAVQAEGKADTYPDRSRWRAVTSGGYLWVTLTAAFADGKPIFCQTSQTTVRVSEPTSSPGYVSGSKTAALFLTPEGIIAGVHDESWPGMGIWVGDGNVSSGSSPDLLPYGLFIDATKDRVFDSTIIEVDRMANDRDRAGQPERFPLPRPTSAVSRVDRPAPPGDRTSDRGQWLKQCLDKSMSPVTDPDMWQPGASVILANARHMILRSGQNFAYCFTDRLKSTVEGLADFIPWGFGISTGGVNETGKDRPALIPAPSRLENGTEGKEIVTGALPAGITRLEIEQQGHAPVQADVWNATFAAALAEARGHDDRVRGFDAAGNKIFDDALGNISDF